MNRIGYRRWRCIAVVTLLGGATHGAWAQDLRGERIDLHPVRDQIGVVTRVEDQSAWVRLPRPAMAGQAVAFLLYSDGGDTLAAGKIAWAAPVAPYEALVTGIHATATRHPVNPYDSVDAWEAPAKRTRRYGARGNAEIGAVSLAKGFFVRTAVAATPSGPQATEPVRAYIAALRALKPPGGVATIIADQAARALPANGEAPARSGDDEVDYAMLYDNLARFQHLGGADAVVEYLLGRLRAVAVANEGLRITVPGDFVRAPGEAASGQTGRRP